MIIHEVVLDVVAVWTCERRGLSYTKPPLRESSEHGSTLHVHQIVLLSVMLASNFVGPKIISFPVD